MQKPLILYHNNCLDGFSGAWAAWKKFGSRAEYRGLEHQEEPPSDLVNREFVFIDFCYPLDIMRLLVANNPKVTVLDHHISTEKAVQLAHVKRYSLKHSGCVLSWNFFHPGVPAPWFLRAIEDNDLHVFRRPFTQEIIAAVSGLPFTFKQWSTLAALCEKASTRKKLIGEGKLLLSYKDRIIAKLLPTAEKISFHGHTTYAINTPVFYSDTANAITQEFKVPFGIAWFYKHGKAHVSLRAGGPPTVDLSAIAARFGGGGHKGAAGFTVPFGSPLPWKKVLN